MNALLLGGTGRTGGRVLQQLLGRGVHVRAVVRSAERLPAGVTDDPRLTVVEADLLAAFLAPDLGRAINAGVTVLPAVAEVSAVVYLLIIGARTPRLSRPVLAEA